MARDYSHRIGAKTIRVTRKDGSPVAGAEIQANMTNSEFLFGGGIFDVVPYASGLMDAPRQAAFLEKYEKWRALCNNATLPFYWGGFERERGKPRIAETMAGARWLKERGITLKGHPLCWHTGSAPWLMDLSDDEIIKVQTERILRDVTAFSGVIDMWDVINEVVIMPIFDKYDNGITRIAKKLGRVGVVAEMFRAARAANPGATLLINDFNLSTNYEILIDGCLSAGVPIDEIGLQTHQHQGYMGEEKLLEILARYEFFKKPLHFTEITLTSGHIMPPEIDDLNDYRIDSWPTTPEFEERQAREFVEMMEILYAHPLVRTAVTWEFTDGGWLGAPSGLLRRDGSAKPAYWALLELFEGWRTKADLVTDEKGEARLEGHRGEYGVKCLGTQTALTVGKDDGDAAVIVLP